MQQNDILTVKETAELLDVTAEYVRRLSREGRIPATKLGNRWRYVRDEIIEWVRAGAPSQPRRLLREQ